METEYDKEKKEQDSKTWNISKDFTHELILQNLIKIEKYRTLAIFGYAKLEHDILVRDENLRSTSRIFSFGRLTDSIKSLIYFTSFDIKDKDHKEKYKKYLERLQKIECNLYRLKVEMKKANKIIQIRVDEDLFNHMIIEISEMITIILTILNKAGFIFRREEIKDFSKSITDM